MMDVVFYNYLNGKDMLNIVYEVFNLKFSALINLQQLEFMFATNEVRNVPNEVR